MGDTMDITAQKTSRFVLELERSPYVPRSWSPLNSPAAISAIAFDDLASPLGVFGSPREIGDSWSRSLERGSSSSGGASTISGLSPKPKRVRKATEIHNVGSMETAVQKSNKFYCVVLEPPVHVPRVPAQIYDSGHLKKAVWRPISYSSQKKKVFSWSNVPVFHLIFF